MLLRILGENSVLFLSLRGTSLPDQNMPWGPASPFEVPSSPRTRAGLGRGPGHLPNLAVSSPSFTIPHPSFLGVAGQPACPHGHTLSSLVLGPKTQESEPIPVCPWPGLCLVDQPCSLGDTGGGWAMPYGPQA